MGNTKKDVKELQKKPSRFRRDRLRKSFNKRFPLNIFQDDVKKGNQKKILTSMMAWKDENKVNDISNELAYKQNPINKVGKTIVDIYDKYLQNKGPVPENEYNEDMKSIMNLKSFQGITKEEKNDYEEIKKFFDPPKPPAPTPEEIEKFGPRNPNASETPSASTSKPQAEAGEMAEGVKMSVEKGSHSMPDGTKMTGKTHSSDSMPIAEEESSPDPPTSMDDIPSGRLSSSFKTVEQLNDDIKYFLKTFPALLKREAGFYKKINKKSLKQVRELHSRIVGILKPQSMPSGQKSQGRKVGVVIDAQEYIKNEMKRLLENETFSNLKPANVVLDVGGDDEGEGRDETTRDFGNFEVKKNDEGGLYARREAIYRYLPTEGDESVNSSKERKNNRLANIPLRQINRAKTAKKMNRRNPFQKPVKTVRLKYLY